MEIYEKLEWDRRYKIGQKRNGYCFIPDFPEYIFIEKNIGHEWMKISWKSTGGKFRKKSYKNIYKGREKPGMYK